jgi:hypothetical protein
MSGLWEAWEQLVYGKRIEYVYITYYKKQIYVLLMNPYVVFLHIISYHYTVRRKYRLEYARFRL